MYPMNFHLLDSSDYAALKDFFRNQPYPLSTYSLPSIIAWSGQGFQSYYAIEDGTVIIANESSCHPEDRHLMLPVSRDGDFSPDRLCGLARETGFVNYWYVPGDYLEKYGQEQIEQHFRVTEQREYEDYVYLQEDLAQLRGNRFAKKRNLIHQFTRLYREQGAVSLEPMHGANAGECIAFLQKWCEIRDCDTDQEESLACEKRAIITAINNIDALEAMGILVRINGTVSAFGIGSRLTEDTAVLNFEKAFPHLRGLYQYLDRECARQLFAQYRYINKESDMNVPNLAHSKKSYNPVKRVKSYRLALVQ